MSRGSRVDRRPGGGLSQPSTSARIAGRSMTRPRRTAVRQESRTSSRSCHVSPSPARSASSATTASASASNDGSARSARSSASSPPAGLLVSRARIAGGRRARRTPPARTRVRPIRRVAAPAPGPGEADLDQQRLGQHHRFRGWDLPAGRMGGAHPLVEDALVGAVLIDEVESGVPFQQQQARPDLSDQAQRRQPRGDDRRGIVPEARCLGERSFGVTGQGRRAASGSQRSRNGRRPSASRTSPAIAAAISRSSRSRTSSLAGWTLTSTRRGSTSMARRSTGWRPRGSSGR